MPIGFNVCCGPADGNTECIDVYVLRYHTQIPDGGSNFFLKGNQYLTHAKITIYFNYLIYPKGFLKLTSKSQFK
jgi:hypothetical protein